MQSHALPADREVTIALMRPDVTVGELQAGGLAQPNAEWTQTAREKITKALRAELLEREIEFAIMEDRIAAYADEFTEAARMQCRADAQAAADARAEAAAEAAAEALASAASAANVEADVEVDVEVDVAAAPAMVADPGPDCDTLDVTPPIDAGVLVAEYNGLHEAVVQAILAHKYGLGQGKLPTKKGNFEYTLGPGTAWLGEVSSANYGLFVTTVDQFSSDSRKAAQVMGALGCIIGACVIISGGIHVAYVSLVDLGTGNLVWFNLLRGSQGDVREEDGALGMVRAIMAGMPTRPGERTAESVEEKSKR